MGEMDMNDDPQRWFEPADKRTKPLIRQLRKPARRFGEVEHPGLVGISSGIYEFEKDRSMFRRAMFLELASLLAALWVADLLVADAGRLMLAVFLVLLLIMLDLWCAYGHHRHACDQQQRAWIQIYRRKLAKARASVERTDEDEIRWERRLQENAERLSKAGTFARLYAMGIWFVAVFKIAFFFQNHPRVDAISLFVVSAYVGVVYIHLRHTGFYLVALRYRRNLAADKREFAASLHDEAALVARERGGYLIDIGSQATLRELAAMPQPVGMANAGHRIVVDDGKAYLYTTGLLYDDQIEELAKKVNDIGFREELALAAMRAQLEMLPPW